MRFGAKFSGIGVYLPTQGYNCWRVLDVLDQAAEAGNGFITPETRVLNFSENTIATLAKQAPYQPGDM